MKSGVRIESNPKDPTYIWVRPYYIREGKRVYSDCIEVKELEIDAIINGMRINTKRELL